MKKVKFAVGLVLILMIASLISAYKQGSKTINSKEMADPVGAINYLIEESRKLDNGNAAAVLTERYRNIDVNYLELQLMQGGFSYFEESKDEKVLNAYKESSLGKKTNAEEFKVFIVKQSYGEIKENYITRAFVVVRLKNNIGWLVDYWGQDSDFRKSFREALNLN